MANPGLFVLNIKFKSRWKLEVFHAMIGLMLCLFGCIQISAASKKCGATVCDFGQCINDSCICDPGWTGSACGHCVGRVRLENDHGYITDGTGNYSVDSKCAWLVDSGKVNSTIRFHLEEFATECGWDHIFIHDGGSAFSPLTAAYSGQMVRKNSSNAEMQTETAVHSGKAFIYFFSDAAYNIAGFNISYRFGGCPKDCSGHGDCLDTTNTCDCYSGWEGRACERVTCSDHCISNTSECSPLCYCFHNPQGLECIERQKSGYWGPVSSDNSPHPRTSHKVAVIGDVMWSVGGYNFNIEPFQTISKYNFNNNTWHSVTTKDIPEGRYGHSLISYKDKLCMFGGVVGKYITNHLYIFDTTSLVWHKEDITVVSTSPPHWHLPAPVSGHSANVINDTMIVFFGHSPIYGFMHDVQEYNLKSHKWSVPTTRGALVKGSSGHSSVYDEVTGLIYVFGGISTEEKTARISDQLLAYNFEKKYWSILKRSHSPRYLHSAVVLNGLMMVFGGNTHNDTLGTKSPKCYSADLMSYDLGGGCDSWKVIPQPDPHTINKLARYGHSSVIYKNEVYIFGGFSGVMLNDLYKFTPGNCSLYTEKLECNETISGSKCEWIDGQCDVNNGRTCSSTGDSADWFCGELSNCRDCLSTKRTCYWCGNMCSANTSCQVGKKIDKEQECPSETSDGCNLNYNCELCKINPNCTWTNQSKCRYVAPDRRDSVKIFQKKAVCNSPCGKHNQCSNCTEADCLWCTNLERCVDTNSYTASFPYGICMEWTMTSAKCPETKCENLKSCGECQSNPRCGWCNGPQDTGLGRCTDGGDQGDLAKTCPGDKWYFTSCPLCQCNGHSSCQNGTSTCIECQSYTTGDQCQSCAQGYFGDPKMGGSCSPCECTEQADGCAPDTGDCYCKTKGVTGPRCDKCDEGNKYFANPKTGTCYYELATDYQYTFDVSKELDENYTQINFMNIPIETDRDVDFKLNCSGKAMVNITWQSKSSPEEQMIIAPTQCGYIEEKFEHNSYNFDSTENTTFRIYIYDFKTPFWLQISFVVISSFDIFLFVAIFIGCFLSLMLLAALLWKVKQRYDLYRRRQRMVVEMEQMASRPFATACVEIVPRIESYIGPGAIPIKREPPDIKRKKVKTSTKPSPIAYEPLSGNKLAVISLLVRLPTGDEDYTPSGQCGMAVASTLITLGTQRKPSLEKGDKSKSKKYTHPSHPDTCI